MYFQMSKLSAASLIFLSVSVTHVVDVVVVVFSPLTPSMPLAFSFTFHTTVAFRLVKLFEIQVQNSQENTRISTQNNGNGKIISYGMAMSCHCSTWHHSVLTHALTDAATSYFLPH